MPSKKLSKKSTLPLKAPKHPRRPYRSILTPVDDPVYENSDPSEQEIYNDSSSTASPIRPRRIHDRNSIPTTKKSKHPPSPSLRYSSLKTIIYFRGLGRRPIRQVHSLFEKLGIPARAVQFTSFIGANITELIVLNSFIKSIVSKLERLNVKFDPNFDPLSPRSFTNAVTIERFDLTNKSEEEKAEIAKQAFIMRIDSMLRVIGEHRRGLRSFLKALQRSVREGASITHFFHPTSIPLSPITPLLQNDSHVPTQTPRSSPTNRLISNATFNITDLSRLNHEQPKSPPPHSSINTTLSPLQSTRVEKDPLPQCTKWIDNVSLVYEAKGQTGTKLASLESAIETTMNTFNDQGTQSGEDEVAALQQHAEQIQAVGEETLTRRGVRAKSFKIRTKVPMKAKTSNDKIQPRAPGLNTTETAGTNHHKLRSATRKQAQVNAGDRALPIQPEMDRQFEVKKITEHRKVHKGIEYLVEWEGYPMEEASWVAEANFNAMECINDYWQSVEEPME